MFFNKEAVAVPTNYLIDIFDGAHWQDALQQLAFIVTLTIYTSIIWKGFYGRQGTFQQAVVAHQSILFASILKDKKHQTSSALYPPP